MKTAVPPLDIVKCRQFFDDFKDYLDATIDLHCFPWFNLKRRKP